MGSAIAAGHITKAQKEKTIECLGHYSATAVLPAETIEVKNMELALASVKVIREYLASEGVKDDEMNKGMNIYVDKVYGKPFNKFVLRLTMLKNYYRYANCLQLEADLFPIRLSFIDKTFYSNFFIFAIKQFIKLLSLFY